VYSHNTNANVDPVLYDMGQDAFVQLILTELFIGHECCQLANSRHLSAHRISALLQMAKDALSTASRIFWQLDAAHQHVDHIIVELEHLRMELSIFPNHHRRPDSE